MTQALANKSLLPGLQGHVLTVHRASDQDCRSEVFILIHSQPVLNGDALNG